LKILFFSAIYPELRLSRNDKDFFTLKRKLEEIFFSLFSTGRKHYITQYKAKFANAKRNGISRLFKHIG
jgi:hypothetical protein